MDANFEEASFPHFMLFQYNSVIFYKAQYHKLRICRAMTGGLPTRQEASDPARSNGPYETRSHNDSEEEAELVMCGGEMKIHP